MDANVQNTIAIGVTGLMTAAIMSWLNSRSDERKIKAAADAKSKEKAEDYARQDEVAKRAEAARVQAEVAARLLLESNKTVAATAKEQGAKLDQIHILVNSEKTAGMERELLAVRTTILALEELSDLKRASGKEPSAAALKELEARRKQKSELEAQLADRLKQTVLAGKSDG